MKIDDINSTPKQTLKESKARIDHPEDLVLDEGSAGAFRALDAMVSLAKKPHRVTIKFDGSPALIFGWDDKGFVLTDKSGFGAKGYDGMARSALDVEAMLRGDTGRRVKLDTPEAKAERDRYANGIAGLYDTLKSLVPQSFKGFLQGDLMWSSRPNVLDGNYVFGPVKIMYRIPVDSELGKRIGSSKLGLVIHSLIPSREDPESRAVNDPSSLGLSNLSGVVVLPHDLRITESLRIPEQAIEKFSTVVRKYAPAIDKFMAGPIKTLPALMKSYVNYLAGQGIVDYADAASGFMQWLDSPASKATDSMRSNVKAFIAANQLGYKAIWAVMEGLKETKLRLKSQLDAKAKGTVSAEFGPRAHPELVGKQGHEGFVANTEHGVIKLVNRGDFMRKHGPINEFASGGGTSSGAIASVPNAMGAVISRTPNLFGWVPPAPAKKKSKRKASKSR